MKIRSTASFDVDFDALGRLHLSGTYKRGEGQRILLSFPGLPQDAETRGLAWSHAGFWFSYLGGPSPQGDFNLAFTVPSLAGKRTQMTVRPFDKAGPIEVTFSECSAHIQSTSVLIYGSCVSRDAFERPDAPPIDHYIARSSILSSMSNAPSGLEDADLSKNSSPFQRRMISADLNRTARADMRRSTAKVVLVDFIDERFNLARTDWFGPVTLSAEFNTAEIPLDGWTTLEPEGEGYYAAFRTAWREFVRAVGDRHILVNNVKWAAEDDTGVDLPNQAVIQRNNTKLDRLYEIVREESDVAWTNPTDQALVAKSQHRWGLSPFHYVEQFEEALIARVRQSLR